VLYCCYILYSKSVDQYYVGYTCDIEDRIKQHNERYFGSASFTSKTNDWELFLLIPCSSIKQAIHLEYVIKKMKSRKYIENLRKYPEMVQKLLKTG